MWQVEITIRRWFGFGPVVSHKQDYQEWYLKLGPFCFRLTRYCGDLPYAKHKAYWDRLMFDEKFRAEWFSSPEQAA